MATGHLADVGAGRERPLAGPAQDDRPHVGVSVEDLEDRQQLGHQREVDRVEHRGPVEGHHGDPVRRALHEDQVAGRLRHRTSSVAGWDGFLEARRRASASVAR